MISVPLCSRFFSEISLFNSMEMLVLHLCVSKLGVACLTACRRVSIKVFIASSISLPFLSKDSLIIGKAQCKKCLFIDGNAHSTTVFLPIIQHYFHIQIE